MRALAPSRPMRTRLICLGARRLRAGAGPARRGAGAARGHRRARCTRTPPRTPSSSSGPPPRASTPTASTTLLREQRARVASPTVNYVTERRHRVGQLVRRGEPPARRPVRHLRPGQLLVPQRLAVLPRRPELVLDGHDARPPRLHDDRPLQADAGDRARRRRRVHARTPKVALQVDFSDDVAGPFPANFLCFQFGGTRPASATRRRLHLRLQRRPARCPPAAASRRRFTCTADYGSGASPAPDGPVWACVHRRRRRDPGQPDEPEPERQSADKANLSDPQCDGVVLDRTAPAAAIAASATAAKVGDLVTFQAQASDATSGVGRPSDVELGRQHRRRAAARPRRTRSRRPAPTRSASPWPTTPATSGTATKAITVSRAEQRPATPSDARRTPAAHDRRRATADDDAGAGRRTRTTTPRTRRGRVA